MGPDHDLHATIGTAIDIVAARACTQGGSSLRGGVTSGVKAVSLICMKPLRSHKIECISTNLCHDGGSVSD